MKSVLKKLIFQTIFIFGFFAFMLFFIDTLYHPGDMLKTQELAQTTTTATTGPLLLAAIIVIAVGTIIAAGQWRIRAFKIALEMIADEYDFSILHDAFFSYPLANSSNEQRTIIIEVEHNKEKSTVIHYSLDGFTQQVTLAKKLFAKGTGIHGTHQIKGDLNTLKKMLSPQVEATITETTGTWTIGPGEIRYEEEGVMTDSKKMIAVIKVCEHIKARLS